DSILCPPSATCVHGTCVPARVDPGLCRGAGCPDTTLQPGAVVDGGADVLDALIVADSDASTDACANGSCIAAPSCALLPANCGTPPTDSCCNSPSVTGGTFKRHNIVPTTMSSVRLDKYEVTIGR